MSSLIKIWNYILRVLLNNNLARREWVQNAFLIVFLVLNVFQFACHLRSNGFQMRFLFQMRSNCIPFAFATSLERQRSVVFEEYRTCHSPWICMSLSGASAWIPISDLERAGDGPRSIKSTWTLESLRNTSWKLRSGTGSDNISCIVSWETVGK